MKESRIQMGMPVSLTIPGAESLAPFSALFAFFDEVDARFSTYKPDSEISRLNRGELARAEASADMQEIFAIAETAKERTNGYFDIRTPDGSIDPSGVVKGFALARAAGMLDAHGHERYCIDIGGDIASKGLNDEGEEWAIGIRNPFDRDEIVKVVYPRGKGIATSGSAVRGAHIYDPHQPERALDDIVSITVLGPDALEADLIATAAFAMGREGILFIETLEGFEGYSIDRTGIATMTSGFHSYI